MPALSTRRRLRQRRWLVLLAIVVAFGFWYTRDDATRSRYIPSFPARRRGSFNWARLPRHYPIKSYIQLPKGRPGALPGIQTMFEAETAAERKVRLERQAAVKASFKYAWDGYRNQAWGEDEVIPIGGGGRTVFGGWAATLVDSLDTLWIMGLQDEFREAVQEVARIDFTVATLPRISTFETTIRFLGGLLAAYDLSGEKILLQQATDMGEMLYKAFDTPNHMPITLWEWRESAKNAVLKANGKAAVAEVGSMSMEFTRLSQLTRDPKYFDIVQRIADELHRQQMHTALPGMFPSYVEPANGNFTVGDEFTVSALADSLYEYLPKQHLLLAGGRPEYMEMYDAFLHTANKHAFFRALHPLDEPVQFSGTIHIDRSNEDDDDDRSTEWRQRKKKVLPAVLEPEVQHLGCFAGGMVALASRLRDSDSELQRGRELMQGCVWAYESSATGIMPEALRVVRCDENDNKSHKQNKQNAHQNKNNPDKSSSTGPCIWDRARWHAEVSAYRPFMTLNEPSTEALVKQLRLTPGISAIRDRRYLLRPEAIESVFVLYRITGDKSLLDRGWAMFQAIEKHTRTELAHSAIDDVTVTKPKKLNKMESFWTGETLKYFYLLFSDPELISLDEFVLNTEAHPFRYRKTS